MPMPVSTSSSESGREARMQGSKRGQRIGLRASRRRVLLKTTAPSSAMLYGVRPQPLGTDALVRETAGHAPCQLRPES
jgi:hypothetical protein